MPSLKEGRGWKRGSIGREDPSAEGGRRKGESLMIVLYLASAQHEATIRIEGGGNKDREKELQIRKEGEKEVR